MGFDSKATTGVQGYDSAMGERVRLYLFVTFAINLFLTSVAYILRFAVQVGAPAMDAEPLIMVTATTFGNGLAWYLVGRAHNAATSSPVVASVVTIVLAATYTLVTQRGTTDLNPTRTLQFVLLIVTFVLVLRSSLIPSPTIATGIVGLISVAFPVVAATSQWSSEPDFVVWLAGSAIISVAVTMVTSSTIYGLDRRARASTQLGQYRLERLLGRGGMGEVYLAQHALLQRPTAVKLLRDVSASDTRKLFRQEVQTASSLTHPNTVEIYDYGRTPAGVFYFAMEYVEGATLDQVVRATGCMPPARVVHLLRQAAGALAEAHARGLVHRDIKPSNLMLCERGGIFDTLKVMDFGLVRDLADAGDEAENALTGTPLYLAPETILDAGGALPQSDVYALGATAYFLLTGRPPFVSADLVEVLADHLATDPPEVPDDDASLAALVRRCLAKGPEERPADAQELLTALEACASAGGWDHQAAGTWWAEHEAVVSAHRSAEGPSTTAAGSLVHGFGGSLRRTGS